jgi:hypothetical protein
MRPTKDGYDSLIKALNDFRNAQRITNRQRICTQSGISGTFGDDLLCHVFSGALTQVVIYYVDPEAILLEDGCYVTKAYWELWRNPVKSIRAILVAQIICTVSHNEDYAIR